MLYSILETPANKAIVEKVFKILNVIMNYYICKYIGNSNMEICYKSINSINSINNSINSNNSSN